ncbi:MAG: hypothetical protein K6G55_05250 [Selenomonadaceae bacterium]|nr:hypothetical protein [Selenomonadaceae bacterium]
MIHVCFGLYDKSGKYSKFVGATMASIFEKTSSLVTIHILHDATLTNDNRDKFSYLAGRYGQHVKFYDVEKICPEEIAFLHEKLADKINSRFSVGTFYRLLMKKILAPLGIEKVIYLDADIIVNLDIAELWQQDLKNLPLAAVPEEIATLGYMIHEKYVFKKNFVNPKNYFCAGVIVFNLNVISENFFRDGVQFLLDYPACESHDQDILNAFFSENYLKLDQKFDSFVQADRRRKFPVVKKIYHYAGRCIELKLDEPYNRLFMDMFALTPWFNVETLSRIGEGFRASNDTFNNLFQQYVKFCLDHRRVFLVDEANLNAVKVIFDIRDDEKIIILKDQNSIIEFMTMMRNQRKQKFFITCLTNYESVKILLGQNGFAEFKDYVNGMFFLTRAQANFSRPEWDLINNM